VPPAIQFTLASDAACVFFACIHAHEAYSARNGDGYARFERLLRRQRDSSANEVIIASLGKRAIVACRAQATAERSQATSP